MYGKIFASLFTGSMYGKGAPAFSLMSYVIANMRPDKTVGFQVELNVKDLANRIGETEETIQKAVDFLCAPDPMSRSGQSDGRRMVKVGAFDYQVVNGLHYAAIRNEEERREKNRMRQEKYRQKGKPTHPTSAESAYVKAESRGDTKAADAIAATRMREETVTNGAYSQPAPAPLSPTPNHH